jgi:acyl dehydratase
MTISIKKIRIERTLTQGDFDQFAELSGDRNPIHVDPGFSATTRFGRTVSHGQLLNLILCGLLDKLVPGGRQVSQELRFPAPTYADEPMRFVVEIQSENSQVATITMSSARLQDDVVTCEGLATIRRDGTRS